MRIINVTDGSAPFGCMCQVCNGVIGIPSIVLECAYYDSSYGDTDGYICKGCVDKAHELMKHSTQDEEDEE